MDCHEYGRITKSAVEKILDVLTGQGCLIEGDNPWDVDTQMFDVHLRGTWDEATEKLTVCIADKAPFVPSSKVWEKIDPLIEGMEEPDGNGTDG